MKSIKLGNYDMHLALKIRNGNQKAFSDLFERYYVPLCNHAFAIVNDLDVSKDAVQDVFQWIWEQRTTWEPSVSVKAYLCRAVYNRIISDMRKKRFEQSLEEFTEKAGEFPERQPDAEELTYPDLKNVIMQAMEEIPEKRREILMMHLLHGYTYKEIAEILDISVNTVNTQIYRARKVLCALLKQYEHN